MPSASLTRRGPAVALVLLIVAVAVGTLVYPTYPNYDSYYSLLWGREILHLHLPTFDVYRAPTEHPLALAFGAGLSLLGRSGARVTVLATMASLVVLAMGMYRLGRAAFTPVIGLIAAALLLTRFDFPFLAARLHRHPVPGVRGLGGRAGGRATAARLAGADPAPARQPDAARGMADGGPLRDLDRLERLVARSLHLRRRGRRRAADLDRDRHDRDGPSALLADAHERPRRGARAQQGPLAGAVRHVGLPEVARQAAGPARCGRRPAADDLADAPADAHPADPA